MIQRLIKLKLTVGVIMASPYEPVPRRSVQRVFLPAALFLSASLILMRMWKMLAVATSDWTVLSGIVCCLSCNAADVGSGEAAALGTLAGSAAWGALQNLIPVTPPTVAGPGLIDDARYIHDIATSDDPNRAAALGIWDMLAPGMDATMRPLTESLLDFTKK